MPCLEAVVQQFKNSNSCTQHLAIHSKYQHIHWLAFSGAAAGWARPLKTELC